MTAPATIISVRAPPAILCSEASAEPTTGKLRRVVLTHPMGNTNYRAGSNGVSAAPAFSFTKATGTGMFLREHGALGFAVDGEVVAELSHCHTRVPRLELGHDKDTCVLTERNGRILFQNARQDKPMDLQGALSTGAAGLESLRAELVRIQAQLAQSAGDQLSAGARSDEVVELRSRLAETLQTLTARGDQHDATLKTVAIALKRDSENHEAKMTQLEARLNESGNKVTQMLNSSEAEVAEQLKQMRDSSAEQLKQMRDSSAEQLKQMRDRAAEVAEQLKQMCDSSGAEVSASAAEVAAVAETVSAHDAALCSTITQITDIMAQLEARKSDLAASIVVADERLAASIVVADARLSELDAEDDISREQCNALLMRMGSVDGQLGQLQEQMGAHDGRISAIDLVLSASAERSEKCSEDMAAARTSIAALEQQQAQAAPAEIVLESGTASQPSVRFKRDSNTGMFFDEDDMTVAFAVNGRRVAAVGSDGVLSSEGLQSDTITARSGHLEEVISGGVVCETLSVGGAQVRCSGGRLMLGDGRLLGDQHCIAAVAAQNMHPDTPVRIDSMGRAHRALCLDWMRLYDAAGVLCGCEVGDASRSVGTILVHRDQRNRTFCTVRDMDTGAIRAQSEFTTVLPQTAEDGTVSIPEMKCCNHTIGGILLVSAGHRLFDVRIVVNELDITSVELVIGEHESVDQCDDPERPVVAIHGDPLEETTVVLRRGPDGGVWFRDQRMAGSGEMRSLLAPNGVLLAATSEKIHTMLLGENGRPTESTSFDLADSHELVGLAFNDLNSHLALATMGPEDMVLLHVFAQRAGSLQHLDSSTTMFGHERKFLDILTDNNGFFIMEQEGDDVGATLYCQRVHTNGNDIRCGVVYGPIKMPPDTDLVEQCRAGGQLGTMQMMLLQGVYQMQWRMEDGLAEMFVGVTRSAVVAGETVQVTVRGGMHQTDPASKLNMVCSQGGSIFVTGNGHFTKESRGTMRAGRGLGERLLLSV